MQPEEHGVAAHRPGTVIEHDREPGPGGLSVRGQDDDVQHGVVGLPHRVGLLSGAAQHELAVRRGLTL